MLLLENFVKVIIRICFTLKATLIRISDTVKVHVVASTCGEICQFEYLNQKLYNI